MNTTLLITNLHHSIDASALEDMFTMVGNVRSARIDCDEVTGASRGKGYVEMTTSQEAQDCILHFNGQEKKGQTLIVREDKPHVAVVSSGPIARRAALKKQLAKAQRKTKVAKT